MRKNLVLSIFFRNLVRVDYNSIKNRIESGPYPIDYPESVTIFAIINLLKDCIVRLRNNMIPEVVKGNFSEFLKGGIK